MLGNTANTWVVNVFTKQKKIDLNWFKKAFLLFPSKVAVEIYVVVF